ncbi:MAG: hypothetical protein O2794_04465, partial [bacterium]|nr:hypothetical protein [bacterium]
MTKIIIKTIFFVLCITISSTTLLFAQDNSGGILRLFGGILQSAAAEAAKKEWKKMPAQNALCIEAGANSKQTSIADIIKKGIKPSDQRLAPLISTCQSIVKKFPIENDVPCRLTGSDGKPVNTRCVKTFFKSSSNRKNKIDPQEAYQMFFSGRSKEVGHGSFETQDAERTRLAGVKAKIKHQQKVQLESQRRELKKRAEQNRLAEESKRKQIQEEKLARNARLKTSNEVKQKNKYAYSLSKLIKSIENGADIVSVKALYPGCDNVIELKPEKNPPVFTINCPLTNDKGDMLVASNIDSNFDVTIMVSSPRSGISKISISSGFPNDISMSSADALTGYAELGCQGGGATFSVTSYVFEAEGKKLFAANEHSSGSGGQWGTLTVATTAEQLSDLGKDWYTTC